MTATDQTCRDLAEALRRLLDKIEEQAGDRSQEFPDQGQQCARYILESRAGIAAKRLVEHYEAVR